MADLVGHQFAPGLPGEALRLRGTRLELAARLQYQAGKGELAGERRLAVAEPLVPAQAPQFVQGIAVPADELGAGLRRPPPGVDQVAVQGEGRELTVEVNVGLEHLARARVHQRGAGQPGKDQVVRQIPVDHGMMQIRRVPVGIVRLVQDLDGIADAHLLEGCVPPQRRLPGQLSPRGGNGAVHVERDGLGGVGDGRAGIRLAHIPAHQVVAERRVAMLHIGVVLVRLDEAADAFVGDARAEVVVGEAEEVVVHRHLHGAGILQPARAEEAGERRPRLAGAALALLVEPVHHPCDDVIGQYLQRRQGAVLAGGGIAGGFRQDLGQLGAEQLACVHQQPFRIIAEREQVGHVDRRVRERGNHGRGDGRRLLGAEHQVLLGEDQSVPGMLPFHHRRGQGRATHRPLPHGVHQHR